jgi:excisionase family DNA binding protein
MSGSVPFGLRRQDGRLVPDAVEAAIVAEIAEAFLASGGRMKATAAALNAKGYRTRQGARWSDTAVARALRVVSHDGVVPDALRRRCLELLQSRSDSEGAPGRRPVHYLGTVVACVCTGRMYVVGNGPSAKYVCRACRSKISVETLERVFAESLASVEVLPGEVLEACSDSPRAAELPRRMGDAPVSVGNVWSVMESQEKQLFVDVAVSRVVVDRDSIRVIYALEADSGTESPGFSESALPCSYGSNGPGNSATALGNGDSRPNRSAAAPVPAVSGGAEPKAYRIRQVAELLNCPTSTIYDMVRTGALASVRTGKDRGGVVLVPVSAVEAFLERKKRRR